MPCKLCRRSVKCNTIVYMKEKKNPGRSSEVLKCFVVQKTQDWWKRLESPIPEECLTCACTVSSRQPATLYICRKRMQHWAENTANTKTTFFLLSSSQPIKHKKTKQTLFANMPNTRFHTLKLAFIGWSTSNWRQNSVFLNKRYCALQTAWYHQKDFSFYS